MSAFERLMEALHSAGEHALSRGGEVRTRGICHGGDSPDTVSIKIGNNKNVVAWCHKCQGNTDFYAALGISEAELYDEPKAKGSGRGEPVKSWTYRGADGHVVQYVDKFVPKAFRPRLPDGRHNHPPKEERVLLNLPEVRAQAEAGGMVVLCEGETDVDSVAAATGYVVTTMPGGTGMGWQERYTQMLHGVSEVRIIADNDLDGTGLKHARKVSASLTRAGISHRIYLPAVGKDVSDHLAARLPITDLIRVDATDEPAEEPPATPSEPEDNEQAEWPEDIPGGIEDRVNALIAELLDSSDLDDLPPLAPLVNDVLFLDTLTRLYGPSGVFKSFIVLSLAGSVGTGLDWHGKHVRQGLVIYLVAEGARGMGKRKRAWEQHHGRKMTGVKFLPRPVQTLDDEWLILIEACRRLNPALIVIDTQARVTVGVEENSNKDMGVVVDRMEQLRAATGACVLVVHHSGHEQSERGRGASAVKGAMQTELGVTRTGRGLDSKVTLRTGKQKDDEEAADLVFALKQIKLDGEAKEDGSPATSVVLIPQAADPNELEHGSPEWIAAQLDRAGVPIFGGPKTIEACATLGIRARKDKIEQAVKIRKSRSGDLPPNLPRDLEASHPPKSGGGNHISTGQTSPGNAGGRWGEPSLDLPPPSPSLREGGGGAGETKDGPTALCDVCLRTMVRKRGSTRHDGCKPLPATP
ncbi:AAA family ATPase [Streptosporangium sp. NPDC050855]|uniref:AAA family ATPase n=1 Tax=Streptosporangium sp. NPDC050855 TaxID=3366194 RepID=UPI003792BEA1